VDEDVWDDNNSETGDEEPTIPCPNCKRQIHEDSPRCPYCENYISEEDTVPARKPWWIYVGAVLCLYVVYRWIAG
jgi:uncharacterized paraquat-inducible protein A